MGVIMMMGLSSKTTNETRRSTLTLCYKHCSENLNITKNSDHECEFKGISWRILRPDHQPASQALRWALAKNWPCQIKSTLVCGSQYGARPKKGSWWSFRRAPYRGSITCLARKQLPWWCGDMTDAEVLEAQLLENLHRVDSYPWTKA